ncbi:G2/mitotic-specific cyclin cdc [Salix suchowensis]|nr:G2/mitotic-specific cyclin cdc [Salix suchowensis]
MFASEDVRNILLGSDGSRVLRSIADLQARKRLDRTDLVLEMFHDLVVRHSQRRQSPLGDRNTTVVLHCAVESSGTGKSRLVDELAKKIFLIPICLRDVSTGYPPADVDVRTYLTDRNTRIATYARCWAFMQALFRHTATVLKQDEFETLDYSETVALFRVKMTEIAKRNKTKRIESRHLSPPKDHASEGSLAAGAEDAQNVEPKEQDAQSVDSKLLQSLMEAWKELDKVLKGRINSSQDTKAPRLLICFDEAHELTVVHKATEIDPHPWSTFAELRATLRALINCSIFSIFLSTTGRFSQFAPLSRDDMSARVYTHTLKLIPPFATPEWIFWLSMKIRRFGLMYRRGDQSVRDGLLQFAMQKLTNHHAGVPVEIDMEQATACLGFRLPFEFLSTTDISQDMEFKQVEGHLRICLKPHSESESMVTISPSEPFVSEAAAALLRTTKWKGGTKKLNQSKCSRTS